MDFLIVICFLSCTKLKKFKPVHLLDFRQWVFEVKEKEGHTLEFLPPYSPQLNPIEKKWAQAKNVRRKFNHTPEQLFIYTKL
ncbi:transposase [Aquimarina sp. ERC-38]|uniref:transposase n=1 Tax=Aquimarina sp. ERC-38 TaxID=2949996 RepID=UPI00224798EF|nr:transposase [Aquimarina sp. ERC-38]UZO82243.1 transposase [Aquimarina sp. ERC-38]